ncbi:hypothetical protein [Micromonospora chersina]|uniref:hypothetical protein n=1 Tax=Micromonospora chersina TaxID=47854 RepID=UPI00371D31DA
MRTKLRTDAGLVPHVIDQQRAGVGLIWLGFRSGTSVDSSSPTGWNTDPIGR